MGQGEPTHKPGQKIYDDFQLDAAENDKNNKSLDTRSCLRKRIEKCDNHQYIESNLNRASNCLTIKRRNITYTKCIRSNNEIQAASR